MYNASKLDGELLLAGLPIVGCASTGRIDWEEGHPTPEEETAAAAILAAHDPTEPAVPSLEQQVADLRKAFIDMQLGVI